MFHEKIIKDLQQRKRRKKGGAECALNIASSGNSGMNAGKRVRVAGKQKKKHKVNKGNG
jgi:hypothetical protein